MSADESGLLHVISRLRVGCPAIVLRNDESWKSDLLLWIGKVIGTGDGSCG